MPKRHPPQRMSEERSASMYYFQEMGSDDRLRYSTFDYYDGDYDDVTVLPSASTQPQPQQQQQRQVSPLRSMRRTESDARTSAATAQGSHRSGTSLKRTLRRPERQRTENCYGAATPTSTAAATTTTSTLLLSTVLFIAALLRVISAQHATDIAWPTVQIDPSESTTLVPCYSDLRNASLNRFFRINSESVIIGAGCMVRIPTNVELMYRTKFHNKETFARILVGDKSKAPVAALAKIKQRDSLETLSPFYGPIQVPCRYATLVLWKLGREDTFEFLLLGGAGGSSAAMSAASAVVSGGGTSPSAAAAPRQSATITTNAFQASQPSSLAPLSQPHYHPPPQYTICGKLRKRKN